MNDRQRVAFSKRAGQNSAYAHEIKEGFLGKTREPSAFLRTLLDGMLRLHRRFVY